jgi:hypothetical protein
VKAVHSKSFLTRGRNIESIVALAARTARRWVRRRRWFDEKKASGPAGKAG